MFLKKVTLSYLLIYICLFSFLTQARTLKTIDSILFPKDGKVRTDVFILERDHQKIIERYARGYQKASKHLSWSMAKTITGLLIGRAQTLGYLHVNDKIKKYLPRFKGEGRILDALRMSSGMAFKERYSGIPVNEDITKLLYLEAPEVGAGEFLLSRDLRDQKPGSYFYYSSGDSNLLMLILKKALPSNIDYNNWPWEVLFDVIGAEVTFEQSRDEVFIGSSYLYARADDYLKFGYLILDNGKYQGKQLIDPEYMRLFHIQSPGVGIEYSDPYSKKGNLNLSYSIQTWNNLPVRSQDDQSQYPNLPLDTLFMFGYQGQFVGISRSENLVMLRLATDKARAFKKQELFPNLYRYLKSQGMSYRSSNDLLGLNKKFKEYKKETTWDFANLHKAPKLLQRYAAKEACSCVYVLERSLKQCRDDLEAALPYMPKLRLDESNGKLYASIIPGFFESVAKYRGKKRGCYLPPSE